MLPLGLVKLLKIAIKLNNEDNIKKNLQTVSYKKNNIL